MGAHRQCSFRIGWRFVTSPKPIFLFCFVLGLSTGFLTSNPAVVGGGDGGPLVSTGISGFSGNPATNGGAICNQCHGGGATPAVVLNGPRTVEVGTTHTYTLTISGGQEIAGGLDVSVTGGLLAAIETGTQILNGEATHTHPRLADAQGVVRFNFQWTAPATAGTIQMYGAGNSVNLNGTTSGDAPDSDSFVITVQNPGLPEGFVVEPVVTGVELPVAFAFDPDGSRLFFTEQFTGNIRVYDLVGNQLLPTPFATLEVFANSEAGLLGIALDPDFSVNHYVYVFYTQPTDPVTARIARFTDVNSIGTDFTVILDNIPQCMLPISCTHNGGYLAFGPDGKLYFTLGDNQGPANAQDLGVMPGKVHRINPDGTIPADNPFPGSTIWSYGLRNSFGLGFHPVTGTLYESEAGANEDDEINIIIPGGNYGWPIVTGIAGDPRFIDPILEFTPVVTPVGITVFSSNKYPAEYVNNLFFTEFNTSRLRRSILIGNPDTAAEPPLTFFDLPSFGDMLDLKMGPDGKLWFSTLSGIARVSYSLPVPLPAVSFNGTPAIGNRIILNVQGTPGQEASLLLGLTEASPPIDTPCGPVEVASPRKLLNLGLMPELGVASILQTIPLDGSLQGKTLLVQGITRDPVLGTCEVTSRIGILIQ